MGRHPRGGVHTRPRLLAWAEWCHGRGADVQLPCGERRAVDRGAEQGDPLGGACCSLVIARVMGEARAALTAIGSWCWDVWYMDDGQIVLPAAHADLFVRAFDAAAARVGATRGSGTDAKSVARLVGEPEA